MFYQQRAEMLISVSWWTQAGPVHLCTHQKKKCFSCHSTIYHFISNVKSKHQILVIYIPTMNLGLGNSPFIVPIDTKACVIWCVPLQEVWVPVQRVSWLPDHSGSASVCCSVMASSLCHRGHYAQTLLGLVLPFPGAACKNHRLRSRS